nr:MAG TPA: hypothetical protein [Caudoviricetes sp.]
MTKRAISDMVPPYTVHIRCDSLNHNRLLKTALCRHRV